MMRAARLLSAAPAWVAVAVAVTVAVAVLPAPVEAQTDTGQVVISVTDAASKAPIGLARVLLDGPVIALEFTGPDGKVAFEDVPTGIYRARVSKTGFVAVTSAEFEVLEGRSVTVTVALASTAGIKTLATIAVESSASVSSSNVTDASAVRRLSDTLTDALGKLSGVAVATNPNGASDATETVSLEGHDPSQTALTLDGVPLNAPGTAGDLNQINTDLFSGASVSFSPSAGALGGGVTFRTLEPTMTWQGRLTTSVGEYGRDATAISEQGSAGRIGIAVMHTIRGLENPLAGTQYLDASGLDYVHAGARLNGGDMLKLRARVGEDQTLTATYIGSNGYNDLLCTQFTGPVPCGYGPGNSSYRHFMMTSLADTALIGAVGLQFSLFGTHAHFDRDLLDQLVGLVPSPSAIDSTTGTDGFSLSVTLPARDRHTLSVVASATDARFDVSSYSPAFPAPAISTATSYASLQLSDSVRSSTQLTLGERIGLSRSQAGGASLIGGVSAAWSPTPADRYAASVDLGNAGATTARTSVLSAPASLRFDCNAGVAYGDGPGDAPGAQNSSSYRASWQHRFRFGQLTATLYRQVQQGSPLELAVNGSALPSAYFPTGWFDSATQIYRSALGCNTTASLSPQNVYIDQLVADATRVYQGAQLTGGFQITPALVAEPYYDVQSAIIRSTDARLADPFSFVISGAQIANVPPHQGGLTLDYRAPGSLFEALADANYVSADNRLDLPGYVTADAGLSIGSQTASLTFAVTNVFDKYPALFATPEGAIALETVGAGPLPTVARPLGPRAYSLTYTVRFGQSPPARPLPAATPRGLFASLPPLPAAPPQHPLDLDASGPACTADAAAAAGAVLSAIRADVAAIEAAKTPAGYPDALPPGIPPVAGFAVSYHKTAASYALVLTPTQVGGIRSLAACAALRAGSLDDAQALHLYVAEASAFNRFPLTYAPEAGLYVVRRPPATGREQFRLFRLPSTPPAAPFAVQTSAECTPDLRPAARALLEALASYVASYDPAKPPPAQPAGWTVTPHLRQGGAYWLELAPANIQTLPAVLRCGHVSAATGDELKAAGLDGAGPPVLNYEPAAGLYLVREGPLGGG